MDGKGVILVAIWAPISINFDFWASWNMASLQHAQLLEAGGFLCKVLFKNQTGQEVGSVEETIPIVFWDSSNPPRKIIWQDGDDLTLYPDIESIQVFVDGEELTKTYNSETISADTEFYVQAQTNVIDVDDNISIYLNTGFITSGKDISYLYTTRNKGVDILNLQPSANIADYRSEHGFTQYINQSAKFRKVSYPHTIAVSFPIEPPLDTTYAPYGRTEIWQSRAWTMGEPKLSEFDILYRLDNGKYYEIKSIAYDIKPFRGTWKTFVQSFDVTELVETDIIRQFTLV